MRIFAALLLIATAAAAQEVQPPVPSDPVSEEFDRAVYSGKRFFDMKEYGSAYEQFAKADAARADHPGVLYNMALALAKAGRYAEAQVKVDRYNQLYPSGAERPYVRSLQQELEFQRELQRTRQADQEYLELFNRGKFLYADKGDFAAALQAFRDAEQRRPNDPAPVYNQAVILHKQGDFGAAVGRYRRYAELESDPQRKAGIDQKIFALESVIEDMKSKIVCAFCGHRLQDGATWCHRCWRGPYDSQSAVLNSRACVSGATATRSTYYSDHRLQKNDPLSCLFQSGTVRDTLRYTPARQKSIQEARKAEGWTYSGEIIQGWADKQGNQLRLVQGPDYLERIVSPGTGEVLEFAAHKASGGYWLLDREDVMIDGQKYTTRYTFDDKNRIIQQQVNYQNAAACNHLVSMTADSTWVNDALSSVTVKGGYVGYTAEGAPRSDWTATIAYTYDAGARLIKEDLTANLVKVYDQRPHGALRDELNRLYSGVKWKRPIDTAQKIGDLCATAGTSMLSNPLDLRPFYAITPNLSIALPPGITKASVTFTYPEGFKLSE
jgi:tetratricopeptide (TPR) repeat protein